MTEKSRKSIRQEAFAAEVARRLADRRSRCPLTLEQMLSLHEHVAHEVGTHGHHDDFRSTTEWLESNGMPMDSVVAFLKSEKINSDWQLAINTDPYQMLGETSTRTYWMPLEREELEALLDWLDERVQRVGCQHDHRLTTEWLENKQVDSAVTTMALLARGGGCDCEVLLNVDPDEIYPE